MTVSTPQSPKARDSNFPDLAVQIQIQILVLFEFVPRNLIFVDLEDFGGVEISLESVIKMFTSEYGVATISRLLKIIGLVCKRTLQIDCILQKRPTILRSLLIVATP